MKVIIDFIQQVGFIIKEINEVIHFPVTLETDLCWGTIVLMIILFFAVSGSLHPDKKLSSGDLIKLALIYIFVLGIVVASYADLGKFLNNLSEPKRDRSHTLFSIIVMWVLITIFVTGLLGDSKGNPGKIKWIVGAMYLPIIILMMTNGKIMEGDFRIMDMISARFKIPFKTSSSPPVKKGVKKEKVRFCCSWLDPEELETLVNLHPKVADSATIVRKDTDGIIKPHVFVEPVDIEDAQRLERDILKFLRKEFKKEAIEPYKFPRWIEFVTAIPKTDTGEPDRGALAAQIGM